MEGNANKVALAKKLLECQQKIGAIVRDSTNPYFQSKYFDINALLGEIKPILNEHGLLLTQPLNGDKLITRIIDTETGEYIESNVLLPQKDDPQKMGSCITYYRRYSLQALLGIEATDDDGNLASDNDEKISLRREIAEGLGLMPKVNQHEITPEKIRTLGAKWNITISGLQSLSLGLFGEKLITKLTDDQMLKLYQWLIEWTSGRAHQGITYKRDPDTKKIVEFEFPPNEN